MNNSELFAAAVRYQKWLDNFNMRDIASEHLRKTYPQMTDAEHDFILTIPTGTNEVEVAAIVSSH